MRPPTNAALIPYTTLFRSDVGIRNRKVGNRGHHPLALSDRHMPDRKDVKVLVLRQFRDVGTEARSGRGGRRAALVEPAHLDRKSTRLNSSHSQISYAVCCL